MQIASLPSNLVSLASTVSARRPRHGVAGIDGGIEQGRFQLGRVDFDMRGAAGAGRARPRPCCRASARHLGEASSRTARSITSGLSDCRRPKASKWLVSDVARSVVSTIAFEILAALLFWQVGCSQQEVGSRRR